MWWESKIEQRLQMREKTPLFSHEVFWKIPGFFKFSGWYRHLGALWYQYIWLAYEVHSGIIT